MARIRRRRVIMALAVIIGTGRVASGQSASGHPDFSGVWVMDAARSDASTFTPKAATYTVNQHGDSLSFDRVSVSPTNDTTKSRMVWGLDGKPWTNPLQLVGTTTEATSVLSWRRDTLVIRTTSQPSGGDLLQIDQWSLSADGKTLSMQRQAAYNGQSIGSPTLTFIKHP